MVQGAAAAAAPAVGVGVVVPWVVSGRGGRGLQGQAGRLGEWMRARSGLSAVDVGLSLAGRPALEERAVVLGAGREELLGELSALAEGGSGPGVVRGVAGGGERSVIFVFPGQGGQWVGMAVELLDASPAFAEWASRCEAALGGLVSWSL